MGIDHCRKVYYVRRIQIFKTITLIFVAALVAYTCYDRGVLNYFTGGIIFLIGFYVAGNIWDPERQKKGDTK